MSHLWSKPGSLVTAFSTSHPGISLVNLIKKHCLPLQVICGSCFSRSLKCSALQVPIFYKNNIHKRPLDHVTFFLFYFTCLWVKLLNVFNLSYKKTSCLIWRYKHQRIFPFPQQCCTPVWEIRISDFFGLTCKTFVWLKEKISMPLNQFFFQMLEWKIMGAFKHVIVQALLLHLTPRHIPGVSRTHMGVPAGCSVTSISDKAETSGNQVCSENGDTRHLPCDNCTLLSSSWWFNSNEDVCPYFDKPKDSLSVMLLWKTEICELKDTRKIMIFPEIVFPTAKKKLSEWWFILNWL